MHSKLTATDYTYVHSYGSFLSLSRPQCINEEAWSGTPKKMLLKVESCCIDYCNMGSTVLHYDYI